LNSNKPYILGYFILFLDLVFSFKVANNSFSDFESVKTHFWLFLLFLMSSIISR